MPTQAEVLTEVARLKAEHQRTEYQRLRAAEYPDFRDYLDAVVKGDTAQMEAYVAECLAVKAKYPKPE
jgi:tRNA A37 N6-isopentenylltransferase MiaA